MTTFDLRAVVFALCVGDDPDTLAPGTSIKFRPENFLGTGFFVAKNGIALTAAHCLPNPVDLPKGQTVLAALWDGMPNWYRVVQSTGRNRSDIAILKIKSGRRDFLPVSFDLPLIGSDCESYGLPDHKENDGNFDYRCVKGHVVSAPRRLVELSFPVPKGMSGSPLLIDGKVAGVLIGSGRSEILEDSFEEEETDVAGIVRRTTVKVNRVAHYGAAEPLADLKDWAHEVFGDQPLPALLRKMNAAQDPED